jgi:hypothetical protein
VLHFFAPANTHEARITNDWIARGRIDGFGSVASHELIRPRFHRHVDTSIRTQLIAEREHFAEAGNADGKRYTAFMATCDKVRAKLRERGPMPVRELVNLLGKDHHYASEASARGALRKWIEAGKVDGVELVLMGKSKPNLVRLAGQAMPDGMVGCANR